MDDAKKLDRYQKRYHIEGLNEMFQFIPYLKTLVTKDGISADTIITKLPSEEIIKKDAAQLRSLMRRAQSYFGFTVPVSYKMTESYIKGEDLTKYGARPMYIMRLNGETIIEDATFTTEELMESMAKPREYVRKKR